MSIDPDSIARAVKERHEAELFRWPSVFGVGVGQASDHGGDDVPCIVVFTSAPLPEGAVPPSIEGVPVFVVRADPPQLQAL